MRGSCSTVPSSLKTLLDGLRIGESPRWRDGRLWFCHWGAGEVLAVDSAGEAEVVARVDTTIPFSIDWLPERSGGEGSGRDSGRLLVVSGQERRLPPARAPAAGPSRVGGP